MDKKKKEARKSRPKRIFRFLPLFVVVICLLFSLLILLLYVGKIDKTVAAVGVFEAYPQIEIKAAIKDTVVGNISVKVGKKVEKGKILVQLKDQEGVYERKTQLKERLKLAEIEFGRLKRLSAKGYVSRRQRQEAELEVKILAGEVRAFQRKTESLNIVAPLTGTVVRVAVEVGEAVHLGQKLVFLAPSKERALRMWIKEGESSEIKIGQQVRIYSQVFCHRRHGLASGYIVEIKPHPELREGENYVEVVTQITASPFPIRIGSRAEARIIIRRVSILKSLVGLER